MRSGSRSARSRRGIGRGFPWLLLIGIIVVGAIIWWAAAANSNSSTTTPSGSAQAGLTTSNALFSGSLSSASLGTMEGQTVTLASLPVQGTEGTDGVWVGPSSDKRLFVAFPPSGAPAGITTNSIVSAVGTIQPLPADFQTRFGDTDQPDVSMLNQEDHYIQATNVTV